MLHQGNRSKATRPRSHGGWSWRWRCAWLGWCPVPSTWPRARWPGVQSKAGGVVRLPEAATHTPKIHKRNTHQKRAKQKDNTKPHKKVKKAKHTKKATNQPNPPVGVLVILATRLFLLGTKGKDLREEKGEPLQFGSLFSATF